MFLQFDSGAPAQNRINFCVIATRNIDEYEKEKESNWKYVVSAENAKTTFVVFARFSR